jgi:hypothetical protein
MHNKLVVGAIAVGVLSAPLVTLAWAVPANDGSGVVATTGAGVPGSSAKSKDALTAPVPPSAQSSMLQQQIQQNIVREYLTEYTHYSSPAVVITNVGADMFPAPAAAPAPTAPDPDQ